MIALILSGAFLLAAAVTRFANRAALGPWRRSRGAHWSEQARLAWPAMVAARSNLATIPAIAALTVALAWPESSPLWLFTGIMAALGAFAGNLALTREIFPRIAQRALWRQAITGVRLRFMIWLVFIGAAVSMPADFGYIGWDICGVLLVFWVMWARGGGFWLARKMDLLARAPERLQKIVNETSARMQIPYRQLWLMRSPVAQAYAIPGSRKLLFTERLLELLPDDELAAVCAHELAHLTESKADRYARAITWLTFLPWIFFNPLTHAFGFAAFYALLFTTRIVPRLYRKISRKLEVRADTMAQASEGDAGTYARALVRLYADNLAPAVSPKEQATHPHLYDRLLAAGVTPDFPRPKAAKGIAAHGTVFAMVAGGLFAIFALQLLHLPTSTPPPPPP